MLRGEAGGLKPSSSTNSLHGGLVLSTERENMLLTDLLMQTTSAPT